MLKQLKDDAELAACDYEINWDLIEKPESREDMFASLEFGERMIPQLEQMWERLSTGESVLFDNQKTALKYEDTEKYRAFIEQELYGAYFLRAIRTKIELIENILNKSALDN